MLYERDPFFELKHLRGIESSQGKYVTDDAVGFRITKVAQNTEDYNDSVR